MSDIKEEACRLEVVAQEMEMKGMEKVEAVVAGSEAEGLYRLLRGAMSHPSISSTPHPPRKLTISCPLQFPVCPLRSLQDPRSLAPQQTFPSRHQELLLQLPFQLQRKLSPPICSPFTFQLGGSSECVDAGLRVQRGSINLMCKLFALMCARCT